MHSVSNPAPRRNPVLLAIGLVLLALACAPLAGTGLAATSETCLRRCLTVCSVQDKGGGEVCLRSCLKDCPAQCGTVGVDCALICLKSPGARAQTAAGPDALAALAGKCAEACAVKPDCRPVDPEVMPGPPADLRPSPNAPPPNDLRPSSSAVPPADLRPTPSASAPAASTAGTPAAPLSGKGSGEVWKRYEPKGRYFSLPLPPGWEILEEEDALAAGRDFELKLRLPGEAGLDYALISVRYVASPHRSAERFVHDLEHPAFAPGRKAEVTRASLSGRAVWRAEMRGVRTLIGFKQEVPNLARTVVLPLPTGFFVLSLDTPQAQAERLGPAFERLAREFRPQVTPRPRGVELTAAENAVCADFFRSGGRLERPAPAQQQGQDSGAPPDLGAPGREDSLRYLEHTAQVRLVAGRTLVAPALDKDSLAELVHGCGALPAGLARAWDAVRGQKVLVTDRIAPGLNVQEEAALQPSLSSLGELTDRRMGGAGGHTGRNVRAEDLALVSRVAFSADGRTALFYVAHGQTSPGTSHFVLLTRSETGWAVRCFVQHDMIIF